MKIQHLFLKRTFSKILETDGTSGCLLGHFQWDSIPQMWERDPSSSLYLRNSSLFSEFGWRQSSSPLEMEKKNAHCPGCQPHPCSNSEALDLNSKGGAKMTGSREFFLISALLNEEKNLRWFHQQQQYQFSGTAVTEAQIPASWSQAQQCKYFQLCIPHSKMAACSSVLCHGLGCGATGPGSLWS